MATIFRGILLLLVFVALILGKDGGLAAAWQSPQVTTRSLLSSPRTIFASPPPSLRYSNSLWQSHLSSGTTLYAAESSSSPSLSPRQRLELCLQQLRIRDGFDRWRFLQRLLDNETDPRATNQLLYGILEFYDDDDNSITNPERTNERRAAVRAVLDQRVLPVIHNNNDNDDNNNNNDDDDDDNVLLFSLEALPPRQFHDDNDDNGSTTADDDENSRRRRLELWNLLEQTLADPDLEEDDFKGTWDTIGELYGREGLKINQRENKSEWRVACLVARVLIYYNFLQLTTLD